MANLTAVVHDDAIMGVVIVRNQHRQAVPTTLEPTRSTFRREEDWLDGLRKLQRHVDEDPASRARLPRAAFDSSIVGGRHRRSV